MEISWKKLGLYFAAGCLGGIAINTVNLILGLVNLRETFGVDLARDNNITALYSDLLWGGIWGLLFILPLLPNMLILKGILLSIIPTLVQLFVLTPITKGTFNTLDVYSVTTLFIFALNLIWGITAGAFLSYIGPEFDSPEI